MPMGQIFYVGVSSGCRSGMSNAGPFLDAHSFEGVHLIIKTNNKKSQKLLSGIQLVTVFYETK